MTEEQKDRCPDEATILSAKLFDPLEPRKLRCEKPAGHRGVHEAEGIEWWDEK